MIKPTIGRVVWYNDGTDQRNPALICYVWSDEMVNLACFDRNGNSYGRNSITLIQEGECPIGCCEWMPYQKQIAAQQ